LVADVVGIVNEAAPRDSASTGVLSFDILAGTPRGRGTSSSAPATQALDSLRRYLGTNTDLNRLSLLLDDRRSFVVPHFPAIGDLRLNLLGSADQGQSSYLVSGPNVKEVDQIADRIEAFARASATWRGSQHGEMLRSATKVLALLLIAIAVALRDRRRSWLLYPASAVVFIASFVLPYTALFNDLTIFGGR